MIKLYPLGPTELTWQEEYFGSNIFKGDYLEKLEESYDKFMNKNKIKKLELGCGERPTPGYIHQDIVLLEGVKLDYCCKITELPETLDESFDEVIAVGVMEHLRRDEFIESVNRIYELLKTKGCFLFDVPDMKVWFQYVIDNMNGKETPFTPEHNLCTVYGWQRWDGDEHKWGYDEKLLADIILNKTEFENVLIYKEEKYIGFKERGIKRNRFDRPEDAHLYVRVDKECIDNDVIIASECNRRNI